MKIRLVEQGNYDSEIGFFRTMFPNELSKIILKNIYRYSSNDFTIFNFFNKIYEGVLK